MVGKRTVSRQYKECRYELENCHQCSGKYLDGLIDKYIVTKDSAHRAGIRLKLIVERVREIWEITQKSHRIRQRLDTQTLWRYEPIFLRMFETSVDQYSDITFGLEKYYNELAAGEEKKILAEMLLSFADWWNRPQLHDEFFGITVGGTGCTLSPRHISVSL